MSETNTVSPLRQRVIEDMAARKLNPITQRSHIYSCIIYWPDVACRQTCRRLRDNITPIIEIGANIKSP